MKDIERRLKEGSKRETDPKKGVYESKHKGESRKRKEREGGRNKDVIEQPWEDNDAQDHMPIASEVAVESLVIQNCSYVLLDKVLLYIECPCEKKFMYIMEAGQKKELRIKTRLQCQKCQAVMGIIM